MKKILILPLFFGCWFANAQANSVPVITSFTVANYALMNRVTITYSVTDAENNPLEISVVVSDDNGANYYISPSSLSGQVGYPIAPGSGKVIHWNYGTSFPEGTYKIKLVANDRQVPTVASIISQVDSLNLKNYVTYVAKPRGINTGSTNSTNLNNIKNYINSRFVSYGLSVQYQNWLLETYQARNIIADKKGLVRQGRVYIADAHFDGHHITPGADDNASGVAGVIEAARILSQYQFKNTLRFIGFDLEEVGLKGSHKYITDGIDSRDGIFGVLNLEMIGYYSNVPGSQAFPSGYSTYYPTTYAEVAADAFKGNFALNVSDPNSVSLMNTFKSNATLHVPALRVLNITALSGPAGDDLRRSDHKRFWDAGIKAIMINDASEFRNPNYHTVNDVSATLNYTFMYNVVKATIATLVELGELMHAGTSEANVTIFRIPVLEPGPLPFEPLSIDGGFVISPNPVNGMATVTWDKELSYTNLSLVDMNGRIVFSDKLRDAQYQLKTDGLAAGTYTLVLSNGKADTSQRLVIAK